MEGPEQTPDSLVAGTGCDPLQANFSCCLVMHLSILSILSILFQEH